MSKKGCSSSSSSSSSSSVSTTSKLKVLQPKNESILSVFEEDNPKEMWDYLMETVNLTDEELREQGYNLEVTNRGICKPDLTEVFKNLYASNLKDCQDRSQTLTQINPYKSDRKNKK